MKFSVLNFNIKGGGYVWSVAMTVLDDSNNNCRCYRLCIIKAEIFFFFCPLTP